MTLIEKIQNLLPRAADIPAALLSDIPCIQKGYLVNGEIRVWDGPRQEVLSPVWVAGDASPTPFFIGEYPLLTELRRFRPSMRRLMPMIMDGGCGHLHDFDAGACHGKQRDLKF